jgi:hypothetical protein
LLKSLQAISATIEPPLEPEMRIAGPSGKFVVKPKLGELHLVSWSKAHKGGVVTPQAVLDAVCGAEAEEGAAPARAAGPSRAAKGSGRSAESKLTLAGLTLAILAVNAFTVWFVTRPPRTLAEAYKLLPAAEGEVVLQMVAGKYETGQKAGDRRLEIAKDGAVERIKLGTGGAPRDKQNYTTKPAETDGKKALLTNRKTLIKVKDPTSVVLYGDTYTKVAQ